MSSLSLAARQRGPHHGHFLYLYSHARTNQVVYSLTRALDNTAVLDQLPYLGKKSVPPALRKDLWRPFATVKFPTPEYGLSVMQKLREYRLLRDYSWTWKPTKEELMIAKNNVKNGGKAKFDMALPSMRERAKLMMDQRGYSVADLADVIGKEIRRTEELEIEGKEKKRAVEEKKAQEWDNVVEMARKATEGGVGEVNAHITKLEQRMAKTTSTARKQTTATGIKMLKMKRNHLVRAQEAIAFVNGEDVPLERRIRWNLALQAMVQDHTTSPVIPLTPESAQNDHQKKAIEKAIAVAKASTTTPLTKSQHKLITPGKPTKPDARGPRLQQQALNPRPGLKAHHILIQWHDLADAEYAAEWPDMVYHEWMGVSSQRLRTRHTAPQAGLAPQGEVKVTDLTEEEEKQMEEGVDLDGEGVGKEDEDGGEREGEEGGSGEGKGESGVGGEEKKGKGLFGRVKDSIPFFGGRKRGGDAVSRS